MLRRQETITPSSMPARLTQPGWHILNSGAIINLDGCSERLAVPRFLTFKLGNGSRDNGSIMPVLTVKMQALAFCILMAKRLAGRTHALPSRSSEIGAWAPEWEEISMMLGLLPVSWMIFVSGAKP
jgi:hypothetical protein